VDRVAAATQWLKQSPKAQINLCFDVAEGADLGGCERYPTDAAVNARGYNWRAAGTTALSRRKGLGLS
jgi:hypothetical protein